MNAAKICRSSSFSPLPFESERTAARAGPDRFVRKRVVVLGSSMFGRRMAWHQLRHFHETCVEQAAGSPEKQNQHQRGFRCEVKACGHAITYRAINRNTRRGRRSAGESSPSAEDWRGVCKLNKERSILRPCERP
ncbi:MAG: hypothetical protein ACI8P0_002969 [Planctomycetaceae bacterium]|jgi:hypothetical protein